MLCLTLRLFLVILLVTLQGASNIIVESVLVEVEQGWLRGEIKTTSTNMGKYYSFKGIPYAAPPLGRLRFKAPEPPIKWNGTRNAIEHCSICMQLQSLTSINRTAIGSEDCLCLNVYSPDLKPKRLMPVMFFIHGGFFIAGSGNSNRYSPDFLMPFGVVIVTVNYRLGPFGFLAIGTEQVPGNAGLKDNIAALQWVQSNIEIFGGDPKCVTIFGQSAGASMVSLHVIAPSAKDLFKRAIVMSGTCFTDQSTKFEPQRRAFALGSVIGLDTSDPLELTTFLQNVSPEKLIEARPNILISDEILNNLYILTYFTPNVEVKYDNGEGQYLTTSPRELMRRRHINKVDLMIGQTADEALRFTADIEALFLEYYSKYKELLVPLQIALFRSREQILHLADQVSSYYFSNKTINRKNILDFNDFNTDFRYSFYIHDFIDKLPKLPSVRRYFYEFAIYSSRNFYSQLGAKKYGLEKATHSDDLPYLFDGSSYNQTVDVNSKVFEYIQLMCKLYTDFAKHGNPTPNDSLGLIWPEYDPNKSYVTIERNGTLTAGIISNSNNPNLKFWRDLYKSTGIDV